MLDGRVRPPGGLSWGVAELASLSKIKSQTNLDCAEKKVGGCSTHNTRGVQCPLCMLLKITALIDYCPCPRLPELYKGDSKHVTKPSEDPVDPTLSTSREIT